MGYSHAVVLRPEGRSISEVSRETGVNEQTIRNWIKRSKTGILADGNQDSCPRFLTPKEKYQLVVLFCLSWKWRNRPVKLVG